MSVVVATLVQYEPELMRLSDHQARRLAAAAGPAVTVTPAPDTGWWSITARDHVGSLVVDDLELLIRPKVRPENLFLMLEVGLPPRAWRREAFGYAASTDLLPSVISFFARTVETTLARGVLRSYRAHADRVVALRGRLDVTAQLRNPAVVAPIACRFDEYTADINENRYLRAALRLSIRVPRVLVEDRRRLLRNLASLEEVADIPVRPDDLERMTFTRLNVHYEPALRLARLLMENVSLRDQRGRTAASSFLVDMNKLYERFVTERLRRALRGRLEVRSEPPVHLGEGRRVLMKPDLEFRRHGRTVLVGDTKYKLTADAKARNADYYQMLAYTTALDISDGVLIYCLAEGGTPERTVTVRHNGRSLHTKAIDLSGSPTEVAAELDSLADWIADRTQGRSV